MLWRKTLAGGGGWAPDLDLYGRDVPTNFFCPAPEFLPLNDK